MLKIFQPTSRGKTSPYKERSKLIPYKRRLYYYLQNFYPIYSTAICNTLCNRRRFVYTPSIRKVRANLRKATNSALYPRAKGEGGERDVRVGCHICRAQLCARSPSPAAARARAQPLRRVSLSLPLSLSLAKSRDSAVPARLPRSPDRVRVFLGEKEESVQERESTHVYIANRFFFSLARSRSREEEGMV